MVSNATCETKDWSLISWSLILPRPRHLHRKKRGGHCVRRFRHWRSLQAAIQGETIYISFDISCLTDCKDHHPLHNSATSCRPLHLIDICTIIRFWHWHMLWNWQCHLALILVFFCCKSFKKNKINNCRTTRRKFAWSRARGPSWSARWRDTRRPRSSESLSLWSLIFWSLLEEFHPKTLNVKTKFGWVSSPVQVLDEVAHKFDVFFSPLQQTHNTSFAGRALSN